MIDVASNSRAPTKRRRETPLWQFPMKRLNSFAADAMRMKLNESLPGDSYDDTTAEDQWENPDG